jgi:hypothetical protein
VFWLLHFRDVTTSMAQEGVEDVRDFKWESQLRYYWEHHDAPPSGVKPQVCVRRLLQSVFDRHVMHCVKHGQNCLGTR